MESSISTLSDRLRETNQALKGVSSTLLTLRGKRDYLTQNQADLEVEISSLNSRLENLKLIETYLAQFADERQLQVYRQIEVTVTEGLKAVFNEDLRLVVSTRMVGARSETIFSLVSQTSEGELTTEIMDARGGGVAAIVGFLIQAVLVLLTPGLRPLIFLDESFRNVSSEYQVPLGEFIRDLCERTGLQVVLVTHQPEIAESATNWYNFSQKDGITKIAKVL